MSELDGWINTAIRIYTAMALAFTSYSFIGWLWEYIIFPLFS